MSVRRYPDHHRTFAEALAHGDPRETYARLVLALIALALIICFAFSLLATLVFTAAITAGSLADDRDAALDASAAETGRVRLLGPYAP